MLRPARRHLLVFAATALLVPITGTPHPTIAATRYLDATFNVDVQHDVVYGSAINIDGTPITLTLDLYTPRGDSATNRPVFVYAHGGFFFVGDKSTTTTWATRMAQRGYVAASINYRLGLEPVFAPVDTPTEFQVINNARADMQTSVRWFRANAASLRIDPDRIAVGGVSAGAVTALGVAAGADDPLPGDYADESSAVCTAVSISGANEPAAIGPNDAGAIFHHGSIDTVVPYDQAIQTRDAMLAAGLAVQWNEYPNEGHSLSDASLTTMVQPTIQWLYDHVATAPFPCSPAMALGPPVASGHQTSISGLANRSGVVSLVGVDNQIPGFVQVLPCGSTAGASSNLNADRVRQIRSVLAVVQFDAQGHACLFNQVRTHLVADLQGYFAPLAFDDVPDSRLLDTRGGTKPRDASQTIIAGRPNSTAVVSVVITETTSAGYVQVLPCGTAPGAASNLNADGANQTRAGLAFVRFDAQGTACVFTQKAAHLVVDLQGYMTDGSFDDITDDRLLDSRLGARPAGGSSTQITGRANATGVVSIVATETGAAGYVQVLPCGAVPGAYSNLNTDGAGQTIAGLAFVHFDAQGHACLFNQADTHLVIDVQGYLADGAFVDIADERLLDTRLR
jgi:predicted esterase